MFELTHESSSSSSASRPSEVYEPTLIMGDLDSLSPSVRKHYEEQGVPCMDLSTDQDSTDLDKCLSHVKRRQTEEQQKGGDKKDQEDLVVVVGALCAPGCRSVTLPGLTGAQEGHTSDSQLSVDIGDA